jgi:RNA polymerase sigma factor (sigma-70 family)
MVAPAPELLREWESRDSDRELLARFVAASDQDAFALLVDRHGPLVQRVCRRVLGDAHLADDAFQATFLLLARKAASLANADAIGSWLFGVARRVSLATRRKLGRTALSLTPDVDREVPPQQHDADDLLALLQEELARLPDHLRAPLIACYLQGLSQDEAARALGWSVGTLRRRLDEGRELLRSRLATRGGSLPAFLAGGTVATEAVPAALRAAVLALAAGGPVPASVATLLAGTSSGLVKGALVAVSVLLIVGLGYAAMLPATPPPAPVTPALEPVPDGPPDGVPVAGVEPLPRDAVARLGTTAFRHGTSGVNAATEGWPAVHALAFQPDGTLVSVGAERVRFWEPETGRELQPDRPLLASPLRSDRGTHFLDAGRLLLVPDTTPLGGVLATATVWDLRERRPLRRIRFEQHPTPGSFEGTTVVASTGRAFADRTRETNRPVRIWDASGLPRATLDATFTASSLFLLPDGESAVAVDAGPCVRVWDTHTGELTRTFGGDLEPFGTYELSPDGCWLATASGAGKTDFVLRLWNVPEGRLVRTLPWPELPASLPNRVTLLFSSDSSALVAVGDGPREEQRLYFGVWSLATEERTIWQAPSHGKTPHALALDTLRNRLALSAGGTVRLFDSATGRELGPADAHKVGIQSVRFDATGDTICSIDTGGQLRTWDSVTGQSLQTRPSTPGDMSASILGLSVPGRVSITPDGQARPLYFDVDVYALLQARPAGRPGGPESRPGGLPRLAASKADLSPDRRNLALTFAASDPTPTDRGRVAVIDLVARQVLWQRHMTELPIGVRFSPDGRRLAFGTTKVLLLDTVTGATKATFEGHRGPVTTLAFRPDGRRLASGSTDSTILIWNCPAD